MLGTKKNTSHWLMFIITEVGHLHRTETLPLVYKLANLGQGHVLSQDQEAEAEVMTEDVRHFICFFLLINLKL